MESSRGFPPRPRSPTVAEFAVDQLHWSRWVDFSALIKADGIAAVLAASCKTAAISRWVRPSLRRISRKSCRVKGLDFINSSLLGQHIIEKMFQSRAGGYVIVSVQCDNY